MLTLGDRNNTGLDVNFEAAKKWLAQGLCVVPVKSPDAKHPAVRWKEYQKRKPSDDEFESWRPLFAGGVGFITGDGG